MIKILRFGEHRNCATVSVENIERDYRPETPNLKRMSWVGPVPVSKAGENQKTIAAPVSMKKLLDLLDVDEYHSGCVDALQKCTIMHVVCKNTNVQQWMRTAEFPGNMTMTSMMRTLVKYYIATGNGLLIKMRDFTGSWRGMDRFLPTETQVLENYDSYGFFRPDYIQYRNSKRRYFPGNDVIHFLQETHKSTAWGLACMPVAINAEILRQIKDYDYNNFHNGLMIDYFILVTGGVLKGEEIVDPTTGVTRVREATELIAEGLRRAKGNKESHGTILIESDDQGVKIELVPLRQAAPEGGFIQLKKDLREGTFAYHRVPPRVVSQSIAGALGGDYANDMKMFASFVVKPLQNSVAEILTREFNREYPAWGVVESDWDFGDPASVFDSVQDSLFKQEMRPNA